MKRRLLVAPLVAGLFAAAASAAPGCSSNSCEIPADCGTDNACRQWLCLDSECKANIEPAGTPIPDTEPGDCTRPICTADGDITFVSDSSDAQNDGLDCTTDTCTADSVTVHDLKGVGAPCSQNGGDLCDTDGVCVACALVTADCSLSDPGEPNETQGAADDLGGISDDDGDGQTFCAVLKGAGDVDWYTYAGTDAIFAEVDPTRAVNAQSLVRVCAFVECTLGTPDIGCPSGSSMTTAPDGQAGCCTQPSPSTLDAFAIAFDCVGTGDDDARVWISVENSSGEDCVPYRLQFHY